ncbi:cupin domain-containing protein [Alkalimonas amylolytica]|uniref:Cupin domain-containing protein n=1 Tax=Alkalimonas amylolytica TaxID=152573 RepID=A0A1H4FKS6_ALKAM|nr:cupin domain-containing protein [Alkalimonas amylolytica]SEA97761.1 Cupin domain-containing protein [Alkalimonas amylolytica]
MSFFAVLVALPAIACSSAVLHLPKLIAPADAPAIHNQPLAATDHSSSFLLTITGAVPNHYHQWHTEQIYVLQGSARMRLADDELNIQSGDYLLIPPGTVHGVLEITSGQPLKVLSIQSPRFDPTDRVLVDD